jgi:hypothetical protein
MAVPKPNERLDALLLHGMLLIDELLYRVVVLPTA